MLYHFCYKQNDNPGKKSMYLFIPTSNYFRGAWLRIYITRN
ncbi:hypothetical protein SAMN04488121_102636 [Chitinophaga filiformis]|uniref:Uncharacterized protein n=1 Tax=Chitinophaga filiformis TaxID=104663 RepID=A0A1G7N1H8_CHIFI|nr:hypothetical protein SAMN04488121_102636 [Chitinophaga filiformis]